MPLAPGGSREVFSHNVADMIRAGHPRDQALAASYREQRQHRAPGGPVMPMAGGLGGLPAPQGGLGNLGRPPAPMGASSPPMGMPPRPPGLTPPAQGGLGALGGPPMGMRPPGMAAGGMPSTNPPWFVKNEARSMGHVGPIHSMVAGRTDHIPLTVAPGSHVIPADVVSGRGQGNSAAGQALLGRMFSSGPFGAGVMKGGHGMGPPKPPRAAGFAKGGTAGNVPIMAAGGEFVVPPHVVAMIGHGDMERGHQALDEWIKLERKKLISTLKKLPGPAK